MQKTHNAGDSAADQAQELKGRFDDYVVLAVRIYERRISEGKAPLTVGEGSIRVDGERSKKHKPENTG